MLVCASSSTSATHGLRARMASTFISSKAAPLYSISLRGTTSRFATSSPTAFRPWVSITPFTTSSPRVCRRIASVSMVWVLPTPGAYPRKSLIRPVFFAGEHSSSHCSGVLGIAIIVVETSDFVDVGERNASVSELQGFEGTCEHSPLSVSMKPLNSETLKPCFVIQSPRERRRQIRIRIPDRGAVCGRYYSRRPPLAPSESDHDCARIAAGRPRDLRFLELAPSGLHVGDRYSRIQLLFFASDRHLKHLRPAELDRALRLPGHRSHCQRTVGTRPARDALCRRAQAGTGTPLRIQPVAAFERQPSRVIEPDSPLHRRIIRHPVGSAFVVQPQRRVPLWS